ncbi:MAG TPA: ABC transporter ATP-binding protein [Alphaproteobacteria bacterium]|nr:ABC transporter ATP-binding protein [Alphaproteobacteria bacterium]
MAASLRIENVMHRYGRTPVLQDVSLDIDDGEFVTLLGPSGCGKTTLLRIAAGFVQPNRGRILLQDRDVTHLPPYKRPINIVFQRPTLFPHLNVYGNVAFGLRLARIPDSEIGPRVRKALEQVRLPGFETRRSHELSGGQMQRVALARVLVAQPRVLLLDEPLSALDLAIRLEMEEELRRLHREIGTTFVYVTHDQREALALSNRIAVLNKGRIEQLGTPSEIYHKPATPFIARFVGNANVVPVELRLFRDGMSMLEIGGNRLQIAAVSDTGSAWLVLRPEAIRLTRDLSGVDCVLRGSVQDFSYRGSGHAYRVTVPGLREALKVDTTGDHGAPFPIGSDVAMIWDKASAIYLPRSD